MQKWRSLVIVTQQGEKHSSETCENQQQIGLIGERLRDIHSNLYVLAK